MKNIFYLLFILPAFVFAQAPEAEKGIHFEHGTFAELEAKATKENKMIMVDAFTTWCGPCKWMVKNIFPNDTVAAFYNANFINAKIDMEKGEGIDIAKKYEVACYPTYLFIDGNGQLLHRTSGSMEAKKFIEAGMNAMDPAKRFTGYQKKYNSGKITPDETAEYILMRGRTCLSAKEEMAKYFATQSEADLLSPRNWSLLWENRTSINTGSREFKYLVQHQADFEKQYDPKEVARVIKEAYSFALYNAIKEKNSEQYQMLREDLVNQKLPFSEEIVMSRDLDLYKSNKDWTNYAQAAVKYADKFLQDNSNELNSLAWTFYEKIEDKAMLAKAAEWAKHSVELQPAYANTDTYAAVLSKLGKNAEARAAAEKAIELAKKEGQDYNETQALLDKLKAAK
jgi:thiol-disulfide isomerase/thioredoxin